MQPDPVTLDLAHIDYRALDEPVTRAEIRAFKLQTKTAGHANPGGASAVAAVTSVVSIAGLVIFAVAFVTILGTTLAGGGMPGTGFELFLLVLFGVVAIAIVRSVRGFGKRWEKLFRLSRFARANGLEYRATSGAPLYPGCVFVSGHDRAVYDHLSTTTGRYVDFGNYSYVTGSGKNRTTHHWGFLALNLDRQLPNMVLDSKANNGLFGGTNLPSVFSRDQVLSLEGDFDRHFTLYCPREYETDALYVFTPDLMALLIDNAAPFDVEIVDDWMFVYSAKPFDPTSRAHYERLFAIVRTVGAKTVSQTDRYHDDRVERGVDVVAPQGRRLHHGVSIGSIILFAVFASFWIYSLFGHNG
jgi:hypothetical protein